MQCLVTKRIETGDYGSDLSSDFRINIGGDEIELRKYLLDTETAEVYAGSILINGKYGKKVIEQLVSGAVPQSIDKNSVRSIKVPILSMDLHVYKWISLKF